MILKAFGVFDIKAEVFGPPFFMSTNGEAVRAFKDLANNRDSTVGRHPEDYRLMRLGTFDSEKGAFTMEDCGSLGFASDYVDLPSGAIPIGVKAVS
ncbi:MAG: nonstructural protein [Microviridae sp.]|nr:MAG: nonstructural protein [Microviridae sp.]